MVNLIEEIKNHLSNLEIKAYNLDKEIKPEKGVFWFYDGCSILNFDNENFLENNPFELVRKLDGYDSAVMQHSSGLKFAIYDTYGDEDEERHDKLDKVWYHLFTPCILREDHIMEVGDIRFNMATKDLRLDSYLKKVIPKQLRHIQFDDIGVKRSFFYYPEERTVSLRLRSNELYEGISSMYKHRNARIKTASTPRIIF